MLILPLHRRWNRSNFPWVTVLLAFCNVFVFAFLQSGDPAVQREAAAYYLRSDLPAVEFPAYVQWRQRHDHRSGPAPAGIADPVRMLAQIEADSAFLTDLHASRVIVPSDPAYARWRVQRDRFDAMLDRTFTRTHALRFSHFEPDRLLSAMFLHGGIDHLLGNMLFLLVVGMLVEGALGHGMFVAVYLLGGIIAGLASLAWHWGGEGFSLGASGAIAALMGAYAALWRGRKVRVFYWFFVVFDYVKAPALIVLGFWFAWLVLYPWLDTGSRVDFADHAGGLGAGIVMALVLTRLGRIRHDFIDEEERAEQHQHDEAELAQALQWLGAMEIEKARTILRRLDQATPGRWPVLVALYRCARYQGATAAIDDAAARMFAVAGHADANELAALCEDYLKACAGVPRLPTEALLLVSHALQRAADDDANDHLLRALITRDRTHPGLALVWFQFALRAPDGSAARRDRLQWLLLHYPDADVATKARFLLGQA